MARAISTPLALGAIAACFLGVIALISTPILSRARIDLTDGGLYSLSDGSRGLLEDLELPITLRLYFSKSESTGFPTLQAYAQRVEDLLYEYAAQSGGKISVDVIDPEPFSENEDEAVAFGLEGARSQTGNTIYFGLVGTNAVDGSQVIPFLAQEREALLEYDLTQLVSQLATLENNQPTIALITQLPLQFGLGGPMAAAQGQSTPYVIYDQLSQSFDIQALSQDFSSIPEQTDLLVVAHAPSLSDAQLYAIDQFILGGGNALLFVDPHSEVAAVSQPRGQFGMPQQGGMPLQSDMAPLFTAWGLAYDPSLVVLDIDQAQRVNMAGSPNAPARGIADYVAWLSVREMNLQDDDIVTGELEQISLAASGHLTLAEDSALTMTPLIQSSDVAGVTNVSEVRGAPDPDKLLRTLLPTGERYVLSARLQGPAKTAFPDGKPSSETEEEDAPPAAPQIMDSQGDINVIVTADSDLLADNFWAQVQNFLGQRLVVPTADNGRFVLNAAENMAGSDALIGLRSRGTSARPFTVIERMRRNAEQAFAARQQVLQNNLVATEQRLAGLEAQTPEGDVLISDEQLAEIERFRGDLLKTRKELRGVQRSLNLDVERLQRGLTWANIIGIPVLLLAIAGIARLRRRRS
ncbi:MAG: Gldg family protein [Pseudomonadota bacterium]